MSWSIRILLPVWLLLACPAQAGDRVLVLEVSGAIGPATGQFVLRGLETARREQAALLILRLDTPGGLDSAMREIIQAILASPVPVATHVAPEGARAASAGTYILYASHLAAMAPATNLGAATPVQIGGLPTPAPEPSPSRDREPPADDQKPEPADREPAPKDSMERKLINDARAYIRALAQLRGRNVEWAEQAVTNAASLSAHDALASKVIDLIATDTADLLRQANGRTVRVAGGERTLQTAHATVEVLIPDWRIRLLSIIAHPQVAYILLLLGVYGLFFELANPGSLAPGVIGGICLLLALFAFQLLSVNYAGLALLLLGLAFMIAEAFVPSFGALGLGGMAAFVLGSLLLWDDTGPGFEIPLGMIAGFAVFSLLLFAGLGLMLIRLRRRPAVTGRDALLHATGVVIDDFVDRRGRVRLQGEVWHAVSDRPLRRDEPVQVIRRDGLLLTVQPIQQEVRSS